MNKNRYEWLKKLYFSKMILKKSPSKFKKNKYNYFKI